MVSHMKGSLVKLQEQKGTKTRDKGNAKDKTARGHKICPHLSLSLPFAASFTALSSFTCLSAMLQLLSLSLSTHSRTRHELSLSARFTFFLAPSSNAFLVYTHWHCTFHRMCDDGRVAGRMHCTPDPLNEHTHTRRAKR